MCDRKEQLIAFLYDELESSDARSFQQHLGACAECRTELAELRATRGQITAWTPPEPDLGFHIVRGAAAPPPARTFRISPAWGLAAAAMLLLAVGAAIANLEVRVGNEGLVVRTGWNRAAAVTANRSEGTGVETVDWKQQAQQLDRRLRELEQSLARRDSVQTASAAGMTDEQVQRVREMLGQSETRQQRILAARLGEITREFDAKRRIDMAAVDQGFVRLQNTSGAEVRQWRDLAQRMGRAAGVISTSLQTK
jgi:hypothetical protein